MPKKFPILILGGNNDALGRSLLTGGTSIAPQGLAFNGHPLGNQHSFYAGKNLINQLSRNGFTSGLNPYFAGNNLINAISGGFGGNPFANSAFQRLRRHVTPRDVDSSDVIVDVKRDVDLHDADVDDDDVDEEESIVDIQR